VKPGLDRRQAKKKPGGLTPGWFAARCQRAAIAATVLMQAWSGATAEASEANAAPVEGAAAVEWIRALPLPIEPEFPLTDASELCRDKPQGLAWIDRMQSALYLSMCSTAAWFDGFFGNARFDDEYQATHGSLAVGALWDERDHWDPSVRFRVQVELPQLSDRFSGFIGKVDADEFVTEQRDDFDTLPRQFGREVDDKVLFGLGYSEPRGPGGHFDASVGTSLESATEPYAKVTYRIALPLLARNLLRLRESIFWEENERLGATTRFDLERLFTDDLLGRWTGSATFTQETEGVRWFSQLTLYQNLHNGRALSYQVGITAESDNDVPITDYGLRVIYRRSIFDRAWLFLELRSSITWPRENLLERREANLGAGIALEMMFGERGNR